LAMAKSMSPTYGQYSQICAKFYDLVSNAEEIARFVQGKIDLCDHPQGLFVGGFFLVAKQLIELGFDLTVCDYSDEMIAQGRMRLPETKLIKADLKQLPFENQFDSVFVLGRVCTHMLTDDDMKSAMSGLKRALRKNGLLLFDNYEASNIRETNYFNGRITVRDSNCQIVRESLTELVSERPYIVNWQANYSYQSHDNQVSHFHDQILHRAFSRKEIQQFCRDAGLKVIEQGDNFDETSFYTLAKKS
jgi:ubiquinone/menaquinone biosynthesis C-methylase UbiE